MLAPGLSAIDLVSGRFLSYGGAALCAMALSRGTWPTFRQAAMALGLSVLGFSGYYLLLVLALRDAGVEVPTLIIGTIPIWIMLLGKPQGLRWRALLPGLVFTIFGVALMVLAGQAGQPTVDGTTAVDGVYWRGIGYAMLAMLCWTAFALLNAAWLQKHQAIRATDWANWLGVGAGLAGLLLWSVLGSEPNVLLAQENIAQAAIVCIATGVGSSWLATVLWNVASRHLSTSLCGQLIVSETLFALLYAFVWAGAWPTEIQWASSALFVLGIVVSIRAHR